MVTQNIVVTVLNTVLTFLLTIPSNTCAQSCSKPGQKAWLQRHNFNMLTEFEYITPADKNRNIQTAAINLMPGIEFMADQRISIAIHAGIAATSAWGTITQWNSNFQDVDYPANAFGAGPAYLLGFGVYLTPKLLVAFESSAAIILYNTHFPPGGDIYNFMLRKGLMLSFQAGKNCTFTLGGRFMHVSNGQGLNPHNPAYEGWGLHAGVQTLFLR